MRMDRALTEAIRMERFEDLYGTFRSERLSCGDAALILGCSERHFLRLRSRYEAEGLAGLRDRRVGRVSGRRVADAEVERITALYRDRYRGFSVRHFFEFAKAHHHLSQGYSWTRKALQAAGLVAATKRGGPHRQRRPRRAMRGMMMHQDASTHCWFGEESCDLVVTMDDATSEITSAFFCAEEGTMSSFRGIAETIGSFGRFCSLYTDRGSHYWYTPEAGGKVDKARRTQVGRALQMLGIEHIAAYSPEARGRSERMFGTLQGRLPKELKLVGITDIEAANRYLRETYLSAHNRQFTVEPELAQSAFVPIAGFDLANVLCVQQERIVGKDNCVTYNGLKLQIPESDVRHHYVKMTVRVHHYPDDTLAIFHGPREIGRYLEDGTLSPKQDKKIAA
jgi:Winged helix-turn helix